MKLHRIYAVLLRTYYLTKKSPDRLADLFYWATMDVLIWGLTSNFFTRLAPHSKIIEFILSGLIFWIIVWRGQQEVSINLLEDLWNKNLINMFVSPFTFSEWIVSFLVVSIIKSNISFIVGSSVAFFLFRINILMYGLLLIPFIGILQLTSWSIGFLISGIILRFGTKVQNLAWSFLTIVSPFSAIYYPISTLPTWAQYVAKILPTSYIFEGIHSIVQTGTLNVSDLTLAFSLSIFYLVLSLWFFRLSFAHILGKGLVKVF